MASTGVNMSFILTLLVVFLFISSEGRPWDLPNANSAVNAQPATGDAPLKNQETNTDDVPTQEKSTSGDALLKNQEANTGDVPVQENPTSGDTPLTKQEVDASDVTAQKQPSAGDGDTKTFGVIISHILEKIPFLNRNKETVTTTVTVPNSTPNLPAPAATGK